MDTIKHSIQAMNFPLNKPLKIWRFICVILLTQIPFLLYSQYIPRNFDVHHYVFKITIYDTKDEIEGETTITLTALQDPITTISLDFVDKNGEKGMMVIDVKDSTKSVPFSHKDKLLNITLLKPLQPGQTKHLTILYKGQPEDGLIISKNKFGERTFFGDNWPDRAKNWIPIVDHPSDKATNEFIIIAPNQYQVIANGLLQETIDIDKNRRMTHWRENIPIPTKVMVFGAARFAVQYRTTKTGKPLQSWLYPQDQEKGFYDYGIAERILDFFEQHIGEYPYQKLANVQSKTKFGGMENASAIFYNETSLDGKRANETLIAHEIAHQWFGNCVSEKDWHHIWLSEGFATYFTNVYLEFAYGKDKMKQNMAEEKQEVFRYAEKYPVAIIIDSLTKNITTLLNVNSYQKASWVLHMLRYEVGEEYFWAIIHEFVKRYKNANATTDDFQRLAEEIAQKSLGKFFHQWLKSPGYPVLQCVWNYDANLKVVKVILTQNQRLPFELSVEIGLLRAAKTINKHKIKITEVNQSFTFYSEQKPTSIVIDPDLWLLCKTNIEEK